MSFTSTMANAIGAAMRNSFLTILLNNTKWCLDRINGDNGESTGASGHDHTGGANGVVVGDANDTSSAGESTTTSATFQQKLSHSITTSAGDYLIEWSCEITNATAGAAGETEVQIDLDSGTIINYTHQHADSANEYVIASGFTIQTLTAAAHTIDMDYRRVTGGTAKIRRAIVRTTMV